MVDRQISAACVVAYGLWFACLSIWGVAWVVDAAPVYALSIIFCGAAATATIRSYFIDQNQRIRTSIAAARQGGSVVRPLR